MQSNARHKQQQKMEWIHRTNIVEQRPRRYIIWILNTKSDTILGSIEFRSQTILVKAVNLEIIVEFKSTHITVRILFTFAHSIRPWHTPRVNCSN